MSLFAMLQVLAFSATYTPELQRIIEGLMTNPQRVLLASDTVSLLGVRQYYKLVPGIRPDYD